MTDAPNDKEQWVPTLQAVPAPLREQVEAVLVDNGFYSAVAVASVEADDGPTVYAAVAKPAHHRSVADWEQRPEPPPPPEGAGPVEQMRYRLPTTGGRARYRWWQQTVEPVFGNIKAALGFRRFSLRGLAGAELEWTLVCLAYNFRRLHRLRLATP